MYNKNGRNLSFGTGISYSLSNMKFLLLTLFVTNIYPQDICPSPKVIKYGDIFDQYGWARHHLARNTGSVILNPDGFTDFFEGECSIDVSDWSCQVKHPYDCVNPPEDSDDILSMSAGNKIIADTNKMSNAFADFCYTCINESGIIVKDGFHRIYVRDDCEDGT